MTNAQILLQFADSLRLKGKSDRTIAAYITDIERFVAEANVQLPNITRDQLNLWDWSQSARKLAPNTRARYRVSIRVLCDYLAREFDVPSLAHEIGKLKPGQSDPRLPHPDDVQEILHNCVKIETRDDGTAYENPTHARDCAIFTLLASTGIRLAELQALDCGAIKKRRIEQNGKQILLWSLRIQGVKPRHRERDINFGRADDMQDPVSRHFGLWFLHRIERLGGYTIAARYPLFSVIGDDNHRIAYKSIQNILRQVARRAGRKDIAEWLHPHSLRHFYATYFKANGGDLMVIQRLLGHANITTTQRYVHLGEKVSATELLKSSPLRDVLAKPAEQIDNKTLAVIMANLIPNAA